MCQVEESKLMTLCFASFINNCVLFASPKESRDVNRNFSKNIQLFITPLLQGAVSLFSFPPKDHIHSLITQKGR